MKIDWKGGQWSLWDDEGDMIAAANHVRIETSCELKNEQTPQGKRGVLVIEGDWMRDGETLVIR